ncbi:MAG: DUF2911 domain-containing protein [bacterium]
MRSTSRMLQNALLAFTTFTFVMCAKPEKKAEEAPSVAASNATAMEQTASNRGTASATFGEKSVSINYGRPQLQGRDVLAMATDGMVWRMGMNEATEIKTDADLKFGETMIPAGQYSLWMKKTGSDKWDLVFNKKTGIWGHEHPAADDLASVPMTTVGLPQSVEAFTVEVKAQDAANGSITAMWATTALSAAFTVQAAQGM